MNNEGHEGDHWPAGARQDTGLAVRLFASSRFFAAFAVFGAFLAAITLYIYGTLFVIEEIRDTLAIDHISGPGVQRLQAAFIEMTDVFLLGTVLFVVSFGLYQLFIQPDLAVPGWLKIENLDQLTARLIEVVGVLLAVTFLGFAVNLVASAIEALDGFAELEEKAAAGDAGAAANLAATHALLDEVSLLELGITVAIVIAALSLLLVVSRRHGGS